MTLLSDLVIKAQRRFLSGLREEMNQLGAALTDTTGTAVNLAAGMTLGNIQPGAVIQVDYELMLVLAAPSEAAITVVRGYFDSTAATHLANAVMVVNPRFPAVDIISALNEDIDDLSAPTNGLFQMQEVTLTYNPVVVGYDLTGLTDAKVLEVWEVRVHEYGPSQKYPVIPPSMWKVERKADTAVFPSGLSLKLDEGGFPGRPIRVQYKAPFTTPLVNPTDDVLAVTGLHTQAHDIPVLGAMVRLMSSREFKRTFSESQGEPRRAQEVPVGSSLTGLKGVMVLRADRIEAERTRLEKMYRRVAMR
jgi:hypothetical protein